MRIIIFSMLALFSASASAQTIKLKNGQSINFFGNEVYCDAANDGRVLFRLDALRRKECMAYEELFWKFEPRSDGSRVRGLCIYLDNNSYSFELEIYITSLADRDIVFEGRLQDDTDLAPLKRLRSDLAATIEVTPVDHGKRNDPITIRFTRYFDSWP